MLETPINIEERANKHIDFNDKFDQVFIVFFKSSLAQFTAENLPSKNVVAFPENVANN